MKFSDKHSVFAFPSDLQAFFAPFKGVLSPDYRSFKPLNAENSITRDSHTVFRCFIIYTTVSAIDVVFKDAEEGRLLGQAFHSQLKQTGERDLIKDGMQIMVQYMCQVYLLTSLWQTKPGCIGKVL